jgi:RNA polymerase sigma-B factor
MPSSKVSGSSMLDMRTPQTPAGMAGLELDDHAAGHAAVEEEVEAWLDEYAATGDPALRDRIVMAYLEIAARLASRFHEHPPIAREDLQQTARMGLVAAVERYDPGHGVPFLAYAMACMIGEIKRSLRDATWQVHVSRRIKDLTMRLLPVLDELRATLSRSPTLAELAIRLEATEEVVAEALEALNTRSVMSLDRPLNRHEGWSMPLAETLTADGPDVELEDLLLLPKAVERLPDVERRVIVLYYFHELRQRDIAEQLGCSQMQVSRLLSRAVHRLRAMLLVP